MPPEAAQQQPGTETPRRSPAPAAEEWPRPDFEKTVVRLRAELELAVRREKGIAEKIAGVQDKAFRSGVPQSVLLGGKDEAQKLADEQDAAQIAVHQARVALRKFSDDERGRFFAMREEGRSRLHPEIMEKFERCKAAAAVLLELLRELLGAKAQAEAEAEEIRKWNRAAGNLNRSIPAENVNGIPGIALIDSGESLRGVIVQMILADRNLRELCRDFLAREDEKRAFAESRRQLLEREAVAGTIGDPAFDRII